MDVLKVILLICCLHSGFASHDDAHTIPIENYETELQDLGEHVDIPETPVRIIKITKTVAVKVPVPYPVKIIEKVPYPVHINKPYPVPVPQIIKVPHVVSPHGHNAHEAIDGHGQNQNIDLGHQQGDTYQVQERHEQDDSPKRNSYESEGESYPGDNSGHIQNFAPYNEDYSSEGTVPESYQGPSHGYHGSESPHDAESFESKNYDHAIREYLNKGNQNGNFHNNFNYH